MIGALKTKAEGTFLIVDSSMYLYRERCFDIQVLQSWLLKLQVGSPLLPKRAHNEPSQVLFSVNSLISSLMRAFIVKVSKDKIGLKGEFHPLHVRHQNCKLYSKAHTSKLQSIHPYVDHSMLLSEHHNLVWGKIFQVRLMKSDFTLQISSMKEIRAATLRSWISLCSTVTHCFNEVSNYQQQKRTHGMNKIHKVQDCPFPKPVPHASRKSACLLL